MRSDGVEVETLDGTVVVLSAERARRIVSWLLRNDARGSTSMGSQLQAMESRHLARCHIAGLTVAENAALLAALDATR